MKLNNILKEMTIPGSTQELRPKELEAITQKAIKNWQKNHRARS